MARRFAHPGHPPEITHQRAALAVRLSAGQGASLDRLLVGNLVNDVDDNNLNDIERIDRLTTIAESRRNASLREIDRRRAVLGAALRRNVQEIEEGEYKVIETSAGGKTRVDE